jgi:aspartyl-tRNA(Asn)/glutamyl-tRNA(Gln) amidotransferase subunit A
MPLARHSRRASCKPGTSWRKPPWWLKARPAATFSCRGAVRNPPEALKNRSWRLSPFQLPLAGIPVSVKDLFDVAGQVTAAGSKVLAQAAPAEADCPAVARLRAAGGTGGAHQHGRIRFFGRRHQPALRHARQPGRPGHARIPGGSSSGAAVSVATGAALVGLGSDTGGSIRIPAALCGIVGFKSTARLVPATGALPLSTSLDTVCALTRSVRDAVTVHEVLAARQVRLAGKPLSACRLAVARTQMQDALTAPSPRRSSAACRCLRQAGAHIEEIALDEIAELAAINATGGLSAAESYAWHRKLIAEHQAELRPACGAAHPARRQHERGRLHRPAGGTQSLDYPHGSPAWTALTPCCRPPCPSSRRQSPACSTDDTEFFRVNGLLLRNTSVVNMLDGCAISLPCHTPGQLPVGLMLWHAALHDDAVLDLALQVEAALALSLQQ